MKKRRITPYYGGVYWLTLIIGIISTSIDINLVRSISFENGPLPWYEYVPTGILFSLVILSAIEIIRGFAGNCYTVDEEGMTTYTVSKKTYRLLWRDCVEYGVVTVPVNWGTAIALIYCTTIPLNAKERKKFLWHRKEKYETTMYFQYATDEAVREFLNCIPADERDTVRYELEDLIGHDVFDSEND